MVCHLLGTAAFEARSDVAVVVVELRRSTLDKTKAVLRVLLELLWYTDKELFLREHVIEINAEDRPGDIWPATRC